jgi:hypothetical protein
LVVQVEMAAPAIAVLFTGERDSALQRFMAEKTLATSRIDEESRAEILQAKYQAIEDMRQAATSREMCFRSTIVRYFGEVVSPGRRTLAVRIVDWLFSRSVRIPPTRFCCDRCDGVRVHNVIAWAQEVFRLAR